LAEPLEASKMRNKLHVRKGDLVHVLSGEDAGKTGKVLEVFPKKGRVVVEGVNIIKKHARPTRTNPSGGVIEQPGPIHVSNVMLVCPSCNTPTRIARRREPGKQVSRVCKRCGKPVD